jgi:hypothetical protein
MPIQTRLPAAAARARTRWRFRSQSLREACSANQRLSAARSGIDRIMQMPQAPQTFS